ncbi:hypothetical protein N8Y82_02990 [Gammaproteobacteria bacterium]|nr:hypothetical protein [Gammaproteobacteria bacterium]
MSTDWPKTDLALNGVIQQLQIDTPTYSRFVFVLSEDSDDDKAKAQEGLPSKLLVSWYNPPDKLLPASQCQLQLRLRSSGAWPIQVAVIINASYFHRA